MKSRRANAYERRTQIPLIVLAAAFLVVYAWPILDPGLPAAARTACSWVGVAVWVAFGADYVARLWLAADKWAFVRRNWLDLVILTLPLLRPLRLLRAVIALRAIGRRGVVWARGKVVAAIGAAVAATGAVAALAVLDAERANPDANIQTYADALWWAISTITTVGYGDRFPTTTEGRMVAAVLMVSGIGLLGVVTASLASWFVERVGAVARAEQSTQAKLDALTAEVQALRLRLDEPRKDPE